MRLRLIVTAAALMAGMSVIAADQAATPSASALAETAQQRKKDVKLDVQVPRYADEAKVRALAETGRTRGKAELERMNQAYQEQQKAERVKVDGAPKEKIPMAGRLVLAVSSSMPQATLREYFAQLDGIEEAVVVLRGFIGGASAVKPTGLWMEQATRTVAGDMRQPHRALNVVIDPLLYRDLGIERVPAVAWLPDVQDIRHCSEETYKAAVVVYGATSIESALREINKNGGQVPETLIARVGGRAWHQK